jgi:hypothetical protein
MFVIVDVEVLPDTEAGAEGSVLSDQCKWGDFGWCCWDVVIGDVDGFWVAVGVRAPSEKEPALNSYSWRRRERPEGLNSIVRGVDAPLRGGETCGDAAEEKDGEDEENEGERLDGATEAKVN